MNKKNLQYLISIFITASSLIVVTTYVYSVTLPNPKDWVNEHNTSSSSSSISSAPRCHNGTYLLPTTSTTIDSNSTDIDTNLETQNSYETATCVSRECDDPKYIGKPFQNLTAIVEFYGNNDGSPSGNSHVLYSDYGVNGYTGGDGTCSNPIVVASDTSDSKAPKPGTILYLSWLKAYAIVADYCFNCDLHSDVHISIWARTYLSPQCKDILHTKYGGFQTMIVDPEPYYPAVPLKLNC